MQRLYHWRKQGGGEHGVRRAKPRPKKQNTATELQENPKDRWNPMTAQQSNYERNDAMYDKRDGRSTKSRVIVEQCERKTNVEKWCHSRRHRLCKQHFIIAKTGWHQNLHQSRCSSNYALECSLQNHTISGAFVGENQMVGVVARKD
jgi:hypothetical protein